MLQQDVEGKTYYTFEFIAQAPNYTRHALSVICVNNGMKSYSFFPTKYAVPVTIILWSNNYKSVSRTYHLLFRNNDNFSFW